ncbi:DUF5872 domain-containing protein [Roseomonas sp. AR75]|uniref:DUF5872 domain-containing protein n=1 Tax=Roseomonas sp. AR75 TaxID=2562311 RepID=UPI0010C03273|nr:DUF5872 domain-containing protein [Roseomonas sp. AR75]
MGSRAERSDPGLWETVKRSVTRGSKGGRAGQWSARKAQLAVQEYKRRGGGYEGGKRKDNSLRQWTKEEWGTRSGKRSRDTGERYLPRAARRSLSKAEYRRTSDRKRQDTRKGKQFSAQPEDVARKTARHRAGGGATKAELMAEARRRDIPGRSRMDKEVLRRALRR